ncbi:hypothetical protein ACVWY2_008856 [Bradyrhizobium sp. JR6.1]
MASEQIGISDTQALDQIAAVSPAPLHLDGAEPLRRRHEIVKAANLLRRRKVVVLRSGGRWPGPIRISLASFQQTFEELDAGRSCGRPSFRCLVLRSRCGGGREGVPSSVPIQNGAEISGAADERISSKGDQRVADQGLRGNRDRAERGAIRSSRVWNWRRFRRCFGASGDCTEVRPQSGAGGTAGQFSQVGAYAVGAGERSTAREPVLRRRLRVPRHAHGQRETPAVGRRRHGAGNELFVPRSENRCNT